MTMVERLKGLELAAEDLRLLRLEIAAKERHLAGERGEIGKLLKVGIHIVGDYVVSVTEDGQGNPILMVSSPKVYQEPVSKEIKR